MARRILAVGDLVADAHLEPTHDPKLWEPTGPREVTVKQDLLIRLQEGSFLIPRGKYPDGTKAAAKRAPGPKSASLPELKVRLRARSPAGCSPNTIRQLAAFHRTLYADTSIPAEFHLALLNKISPEDMHIFYQEGITVHSIGDGPRRMSIILHFPANRGSIDVLLRLPAPRQETRSRLNLRLLEGLVQGSDIIILSSIKDPTLLVWFSERDFRDKHVVLGLSISMTELIRNNPLLQRLVQKASLICGNSAEWQLLFRKAEPRALLKLKPRGVTWLITLGPEGCIVLGPDGTITHCPSLITNPEEVADVTCAGDSAAAGAASALHFLETQSPEAIALLAMAFAAVAISELGLHLAYAHRVLKFLLRRSITVATRG